MGYYQQQSSGGTLFFFVFIIAAVLVMILLLRNPNFKTWLSQLFKGVTPSGTTSPPPTTTQPTTGGGGPIQGGQIYPDASPAHECHDVTDGGLEQGGDRREPQIDCGFDFLNTEATVYVNVSGVNDTLSVKLRGPRHGGSTPEAEMCNNIHYIALGSNSTEAFGKQSHHTGEYCEFGGSSVKIPDGVWVGVKAVEWNEGSGVHLQTWLDNPEGSGWKLAADATDNGGAGSCQGQAREAFTTSPCQGGSQPVSIGFRVDGLSGGGSVEFKGMSAREIAIPSAPLTTAPSGSGSTPTATPTPDEDEDEEESANIARVFTVGNIR